MRVGIAKRNTDSYLRQAKITWIQRQIKKTRAGNIPDEETIRNDPTPCGLIMKTETVVD